MKYLRVELSGDHQAETEVVLDDQVLICPIKSMRITDTSRVIVLDDCPISVDLFSETPKFSTVTIRGSTTRIYCEWDEIDEERPDHIDYPVNAVQIVDFPWSL